MNNNLIPKYSIYVTERKNYKYLYHFTPFINLYNIIDSNELNPSFFDDGYGNTIKAVSLSRNKNLLFNYHINIRITIDAETLSDKYKIEPYDYWSREYTSQFYSMNGKDEDEERVIIKPINGKDLGSIKNIRKYILKIEQVYNHSGINHVMKVLFDKNKNDSFSDIKIL